MFQENLPNNPIVASPIDFPKIVFPIDFKDGKAIYCLKFDFKHEWYGTKYLYKVRSFKRRDEFLISDDIWCIQDIVRLLGLWSPQSRVCECIDPYLKTNFSVPG